MSELELTFYVIAALLLFALLGPLLVGPLLIFLTFKAKAEPNLRAYDPYQYPPPPDISQFFNSVDAELKDAGFVPTAHLRVPEIVSNVDTYLMYIQNPKSQIEAIVIAGFARTTDINGGRMQSRAIEFSTRFQDGRSLDTNNSQEELAFYRPSNKVLHQFQYVEHPKQLYQVHLRLLEEMGAPARKPMFSPVQQAQAVLDSTKEEFAAQVPAGILRLNSTGTHFRPTFIGAYKITLPNVFPIKQIRRMLRKRKCDAMLARWGKLV